MVKKYFLTLCLLLAGVVSAGAQWSIIGSFSMWWTDTAPDMTEQPDGTWTITMEELEGEFKFLKDHSWDVNLGCEYQTSIYGNGTIPVVRDGQNFVADKPLKNVTVTLDPEARKVTFSGLSEDMEPIDWDNPYVVDKGCFLVTDAPDRGTKLTYNDAWVYTTTMSLKAGFRFRISDALVSVPEGKELDAWMKLREHEYVPADITPEMAAAGVATVVPGETVSLQTPCPIDLSWEIAEDGRYEIEVDLNTKVMTVEKLEDAIFVCGYVENPLTGVKNGFAAPTQGNSDFYSDNFTLKSVSPGVYRGQMIVYSIYEQPFTSPDDLPQFRFFTDLLGWTWKASLGSAQNDFTCVSVDLSEGPVTLPIVVGGLGNWGMCQGEYWTDQLVDMTVDLNNLQVTFALPGDGVEEILSDSEPVWYDLQGHRVASPSHGVFIRVTPEGSEKVRF